MLNRQPIRPPNPRQPAAGLYQAAERSLAATTQTANPKSEASPHLADPKISANTIDPTDPLAALHTAYDAWRLTQPQLFWTDENLWGGLDEQDAGAFLLVEPADMSPLTATPRGGLDLQTYDGRSANHMQGARRGQKGA